MDDSENVEEDIGPILVQHAPNQKAPKPKPRHHPEVEYSEARCCTPPAFQEKEEKGHSDIFDTVASSTCGSDGSRPSRPGRERPGPSNKFILSKRLKKSDESLSQL